jgi:hypothetical protein
MRGASSLLWRPHPTTVDRLVVSLVVDLGDEGLQGVHVEHICPSVESLTRRATPWRCMRPGLGHGPGGDSSGTLLATSAGDRR